MRIGELEIVRESRQLLRDGKALRIGSRAYDLLQLLLDADGAVVPTAEILDKVWPSTIVEENNIQVHVCTLRRLLGEHRQLIQTVSGRGYRMARPAAETVPSFASAASAPAELPPVLPAALAPFDAAPAHTLTDFALPYWHGPLFGRDTCLARVTEAVARAGAVVTLAGPAGVGKSQLAIEAARRLAAEPGVQVRYLSLAALGGPREALDGIAAALESLGSARDAAASKHEARALLVLDNGDRVADAVIKALGGSLAFRLASRTAVLVTTRTPLRLSMETVLPVPSLLAVAPPGADNAALDMFVSRVRALDPGIDTQGAFLDGARALVEEMDGLPLAIELAAYHTSLLGLDTVSLLLKDNVDLPTRHMRRMIESRHESLGAALMWTWSELGAARQAILAGLMDAGPEAGPAEMRAIAECAGLSLEIMLDAISGLAESSFVVRSYRGASVSYRIPNTVRRFLKQQTPAPPPAVPTLDELRAPPRDAACKPSAAIGATSALASRRTDGLGWRRSEG